MFWKSKKADIDLIIQREIDAGLSRQMKQLQEGHKTVVDELNREINRLRSEKDQLESARDTFKRQETEADLFLTSARLCFEILQGKRIPDLSLLLDNQRQLMAQRGQLGSSPTSGLLGALGLGLPKSPLFP